MAALKQYDLEENDTVNDFKSRIQERSGINTERMQLVWKGTILNSHDTDTHEENKMSKYNIRGGNIIILIISKEYFIFK